MCLNLKIQLIKWLSVSYWRHRRGYNWLEFFDENFPETYELKQVERLEECPKDEFDLLLADWRRKNGKQVFLSKPE